MFPSRTSTDCSLTQADVTPRNVALARSRPTFTASSKPVSDVALISVTRATVPGAMTSSRVKLDRMITAVTHLTPALGSGGSASGDHDTNRPNDPGLLPKSRVALDQIRKPATAT